MNLDSVTMKELPPEMQPYEKCAQYGAGVLSDAELLACILRTGSTMQTSLELAKTILKLQKGKNGLLGLSKISVEELMQLHGIGKVKAVQLRCVFELARRVSREEAAFALDFSVPSSIADYYMEDLRHEEQENLLLLLLNTKNRLLGEILLYKGTVNSSVVSAREIFLEALKYRAVGVILLHNHPSGDPTPSDADLRVTRKIRDAGCCLDIPLIDHLVIGDKKYVSFRENGYL